MPAIISGVTCTCGTVAARRRWVRGAQGRAGLVLRARLAPGRACHPCRLRLLPRRLPLRGRSPRNRFDNRCDVRLSLGTRRSAPSATAQDSRGEDMTDKYATTDAGAPIPSIEHSLTVGPDGPILLQDHYLIEQMANFNRE